MCIPIKIVFSEKKFDFAINLSLFLAIYVHFWFTEKNKSKFSIMSCFLGSQFLIKTKLCVFSLIPAAERLRLEVLISCNVVVKACDGWISALLTTKDVELSGNGLITLVVLLIVLLLNGISWFRKSVL